MTFTANGKTKFPFRQKTEKLDLILIPFLVCQLDILNNFSKERGKLKKRKFSRFCDTQLSAVSRKSHA